MKKVICLLFMIAGYFNVYSQSAGKRDVVVKGNGDILNGEVHEMTDSTIRFTYTGEKLVFHV